MHGETLSKKSGRTCDYISSAQDGRSNLSHNILIKAIYARRMGATHRATRPCSCNISVCYKKVVVLRGGGWPAVSVRHWRGSAGTGGFQLEMVDTPSGG